MLVSSELNLSASLPIRFAESDQTEAYGEGLNLEGVQLLRLLFSSDRCCVNPVSVLEHMLRQARESRKQLSAYLISAQRQLDTRESYRRVSHTRTHTVGREILGSTAEPHAHTHSTERYRVEHIAS